MKVEFANQFQGGGSFLSGCGDEFGGKDGDAGVGVESTRLEGAEGASVDWPSASLVLGGVGFEAPVGVSRSFR